MTAFGCSRYIERAALVRGLDRDGQSLGFELILVKLGAFLVRDEQQRDAGVVRFLHAQLGVLIVKRGQRHDLLWDLIGGTEGLGFKQVMTGLEAERLNVAARGLGLERSLRLGAICAAEVIQHYGARPEADLKALAGDLLA